MRMDEISLLCLGTAQQRFPKESSKRQTDYIHVRTAFGKMKAHTLLPIMSPVSDSYRCPSESIFLPAVL